MIVCVGIAKLDKLATLWAVVPILDHSANVTAVDRLPCPASIAALWVTQILRCVRCDLHILPPKLVRVGRTNAVVGLGGRAFRVLVVMLVLPQLLALLELLSSIVVIVFISIYGIDVSDLLTIRVHVTVERVHLWSRDSRIDTAYQGNSYENQRRDSCHPCVQKYLDGEMRQIE